jgi:pimeloyl-ACP methyl ester carboxylesterase
VPRSPRRLDHAWTTFTWIVVTMMLLALLLAFLLWTPDIDRATLEAHYLRSPGDMVELAVPVQAAGTQLVRLHVRDTGPRDAPAIVMLHGFGASLHTWEAWAQVLQADHRVIRFDLPGSGLSPPDPSGVYTDARSMQLLLALLDQLGVPRASLMGHSIGGRLAWRLAAEHPEQVDKLLLLSPDGFASPGFEYGKAPEVPASFKLMRWVLPRPLLEMSLEPAYANPKRALSDELTTRYFELMRAPGSRDALLDRMSQTVLVDPRPVLARIQAPTLLLWGEQDQMIPIANSADYVKVIPTITLLRLPGVGHLAQEEDSPAAPGVALKAVVDFLRP